jgi:hypothetical protein
VLPFRVFEFLFNYTILKAFIAHCGARRNIQSDHFFSFTSRVRLLFENVFSGGPNGSCRAISLVFPSLMVISMQTTAATSVRLNESKASKTFHFTSPRSAEKRN